MLVFEHNNKNISMFPTLHKKSNEISSLCNVGNIEMLFLGSCLNYFKQPPSMVAICRQLKEEPKVCITP